MLSFYESDPWAEALEEQKAQAAATLPATSATEAGGAATLPATSATAAGGEGAATLPATSATAAGGEGAAALPATSATDGAGPAPGLGTMFGTMPPGWPTLGPNMGPMTGTSFAAPPLLPGGWPAANPWPYPVPPHCLDKSLGNFRGGLMVEKDNKPDESSVRTVEAQERLYKLEESEVAMTLEEYTSDGGVHVMWTLLQEAFGENGAEMFERAEKEFNGCRRTPGQSIASYIANMKRLLAQYMRSDPEFHLSNKAWSQRLLNRAGLSRRERLDVFYYAGGLGGRKPGEDEEDLEEEEIDAELHFEDDDEIPDGAEKAQDEEEPHSDDGLCGEDVIKEAFAAGWRAKQKKDRGWSAPSTRTPSRRPKFCGECGHQLVCKRGQWILVDEEGDGDSAFPPPVPRPMHDERRYEVSKGALKAKKEAEKKVLVSAREALAAVGKMSKEEKKSLKYALAHDELNVPIPMPEPDFPTTWNRAASSKDHVRHPDPQQQPVAPKPLLPPSRRDEEGRDKPTTVRKREMEEFKMELYRRACDGGRCVSFSAASVPTTKQARCRHLFADLLWTSNQHGHYARCEACDLKNVLYCSQRHGIPVANPEPKDILVASLPAADSGCRTAVAGTDSFQAELRKRRVRFFEVVENEVFQFGAGAPEHSERAFIYPVGVQGSWELVRMSMVGGGASSCPGLIGPSELSRWGAVFDLAGKTLTLNLWENPTVLRTKKILKTSTPLVGGQGTDTEDDNEAEPSHYRHAADYEEEQRARDRKWLELLESGLGIKTTASRATVIQSDSELSEDSAEELQERDLDLATTTTTSASTASPGRVLSPSRGQRRPGPWRAVEMFTWTMMISSAVAVPGRFPAGPPGGGLPLHGTVYLAKLERSYNVQRNSVTASPRAEKNSAMLEWVKIAVWKHRARGGAVMAENPRTSLAWREDVVQQTYAGLPAGVVDMCAWGFRGRPDADVATAPLYLRKPTLLRAHPSILPATCRRCPGGSNRLSRGR
ncbi:unnamed protein product [Symbiodinium sp. KB8]|nr:unnamed protein product [Symbiodinium sp. KB8]